jgi:hypothetical protein
MNDARWDACTEPEELLWYLDDLASDRLLRLSACACCRLIWPIIPTLDARQAVEVSERFADGLATPEALRAAEMAALRTRASGVWLAAWATATTANADPWQAAQWAPPWPRKPPPKPPHASAWPYPLTPPPSNWAISLGIANGNPNVRCCATLLAYR